MDIYSAAYVDIYGEGAVEVFNLFNLVQDWKKIPMPNYIKKCLLVNTLCFIGDFSQYPTDTIFLF